MSREEVAEELRAALDRLSVALGSVGAPFVRNARPGASLEEIQAVSDRLGLVFPVELVELYRWHDGVAFVPDEFSELPVWLTLLDLSYAEEHLMMWREAGYDLELGPWPIVEGFLQILTSGGAEDYYVDCRGDPDDVSQVVSWVVEDYDEVYLAAPSVASMVIQMARVVEEGYWRFDASGRIDFWPSTELLELEGLTFFNRGSLGRIEID